MLHPGPETKKYRIHFYMNTKNKKIIYINIYNRGLLVDVVLAALPVSVSDDY